jgi:glycine/serine hydroxymethyltransferase
MTIRGLDEVGFRTVARLIAAVIDDPDGPVDERLCAIVAALAASCPVPAGSMG